MLSSNVTIRDSLLAWLRAAERAYDGPYDLPRGKPVCAAADRLAFDDLAAQARAALAKRRYALLPGHAVKDTALLRLGAHLAELRTAGRQSKDREIF